MPVESNTDTKWPGGALTPRAVADPKEIDVNEVTPERWLPVVGWEDLYLVSDWGRVWSLDRIDAAGRRWRGRILRPQRTNDLGHLSVPLSRDSTTRQFLVHRLVMAAFAGACPEGQEVRHWDGNPANNRLSNLLYGTRQENMRDVLRYGTHHNTAKTHCPHNHEYTPENTRIGSHGDRNCKTCVREKNFAKWKAKQAAMRADPELLARENAAAAERARRARARKRARTQDQ